MVFTHLLGDLDTYELASLFRVSQDEFEDVIEDLVKNGHIDQIATLIVCVLEKLHELVDENEDLIQKHERATKQIATLKSTAKKSLVVVGGIDKNPNKDGKIDVA